MFTQAFRHSLLFVVLALVLVGCSTEHTLADGSSVTVISGWVYGTRMAICVLFGFLALLAGSQFQENENVGFLLIAFCLGGVALYSFPGLEGPEELLESAQERAEGELSDKATEAAERALRIEESDREAEQVRREAATKKAEALSPGGRATAVRAKLKELDQRVREQKQVVGRRAPELAKYKRDLRRLRRKSGQISCAVRYRARRGFRSKTPSSAVELLAPTSIAKSLRTSFGSSSGKLRSTA
jgi:hypothetical protein